MKSKFIGIDFDGTCVSNEYPKVGKDIGAAPILKELEEAGHKLILWTNRDSKEIDPAEDWFYINGIKLFASNKNPEQFFKSDSPKIYCDVFIDDRGIGIPRDSSDNVDWSKMRKLLVDWGLLESKSK